jgi:hypothetical protein
VISVSIQHSAISIQKKATAKTFAADERRFEKSSRDHLTQLESPAFLQGFF